MTKPTEVDAEIKDILRKTPNEKWVELFKQRSDDFKKLARQIKEKLSLDDDRNKVVHNLTIFNSIQCEQLSEAMNRYVDEIAWRIRNLFELNLVLRYVLKPNHNLSNYINFGIQEELEFTKKALGEKKDFTNLHIASVQRRIIALEKELKDRNVSRRMSRLTIRDLAKEVGVEDEYKRFFDFISRYVHPSAWFVLGEPKETFSPDYRRFLIYKGLVYSLDSYKRIDDYSYSQYIKRHNRT